jgi:LysR family glycine cleavage system transcriptional activator
MAESGYGIALARSPTTNNLVDTMGLKSSAISPGLKSSEAYYLVYQNTESLSRAARLFRDWLLGQV